MQWFFCAVAALSIVVAGNGSAQSQSDVALDFDYSMTTNDRIKPTRVFNDGRDTYIQPDASQLPLLRVLDTAYSRQGQYLVVAGLRRVVRIEYRGAVAIVRRESAKRIDAVAAQSAPVPPQRSADAALLVKTDCAQTNRTEEQEFEITFRAQRVQPQRAFQNKLKRIIAAARQADLITIVLVPDGADRTLADQRARHLRDLLVARGVPPEIIRLDTQFRAGTISQILIQREVQGCGDAGEDADTTALVKSEVTYSANRARTAIAVPAFYGHGAALSRVTASAPVVAAKENTQREIRSQLSTPLPTSKLSEPANATLMRTVDEVQSTLQVRQDAERLRAAALVPVVTSRGDKPAREQRLTFAPNTSVREALRRYLQKEDIDLDWQVAGDLIVEEYADVFGADVKAVVTAALRRLGLKGILIAGRRLVVESAS